MMVLESRQEIVSRYQIPFIPLPPGISERSVVKLAVDAVLRGPQCALLLKFLEEIENPDLNPTLAAISHPLMAGWREHWARRAAHALHFAGRHTPVIAADIEGQVFVESREGVQIFRLADGRYHVVSHFAVPSLEAAQAAATAVSGNTG